MKISNKRTRDIQRFVHLTGGLLLVAYIYTPLGNLNAFEMLVQFIVIPALVATGVAMSQLPRLRKRLRDRSRLGAAARAGSDADGRNAQAEYQEYGSGSGAARERSIG